VCPVAAHDPFPDGPAHPWSDRVMDSESDVVAHTTGGRAESVQAVADGVVPPLCQTVD
jgi:hypothetical protein